MSAIIKEKCPICQKEYEEDTEKYYWHLKVHLLKIELYNAEPKQI